MEIKGDIPVILYDNQCYLCTRFARAVNFFGRGRITMIGHYSKRGREIKEQILDESALEMFWFIDKTMAYGGRAALYPLIKEMLSKGAKRADVAEIDDECGQDCKTVKAVFVRSASLLTNSKKIDL